VEKNTSEGALFRDKRFTGGFHGFRDYVPLTELALI